MDTNSLIAQPDEQFKLAPESLEIIQTYLSTLNISETAETLGLERQDIVHHLNKTEVQRFINTVFLDQGYANQFKLQSVMDTIIKDKLEEAEMSEVFTNKDLLDVLSLQHKMNMDILNKQIKLEELKRQNIRNQTNIQVNEAGSSNLARLMDTLIGKENV